MSEQPTKLELTGSGDLRITWTDSQVREYAVRELREETGIRQVDRVGRFERDMHYVFRSAKKGVITKTVTYFLGRTRAEKVSLSDEHSGHAWLAFDEAMERLTYDNAREVLAAAHDSMKG